MNFDGAVTGGDPSILTPHLGEVAGVDLDHPKWDYNLSGGVTGGDYSLITPLLGNSAPACP